MKEPISSSLSGERLALLCQLTQTFNSSLDLDEVLNRVIDEIIAATNAEHGFVVLLQPDGKLAFPVARGIHQTTIDDPQFQISRGVIDQVVKSGQAILTSNAQRDQRFSGRESVSILGLTSILCAPLKVRDTMLGAVYVENRIQAGIFTEKDLALLTAIAASAAIAIENARLYQVAIEKGRMEKELQLARQVQSSFIPASTPQIKGWDFAACWLPARQVAGDFYDFFATNKNILNVVIADVSDKGIPAALFMANSRSLIRASMMFAAAPQEGIVYTNRLLYSDSASGMFLTLFYAQINLENGMIAFINAGHNPPLLYRQGKAQPAELTRTGMALGVDEDVSYDQGSVKMAPGDMLLLYTDGLPDAIDAYERDFGMERVVNLAADCRHESASTIIDVILKAVNQFTGPIVPYDDITVVVIKRI